MAPATTIAEWMQKPETERKEEEQKMKQEWNVWMSAQAAMITENDAAGKNMRVTAANVTSTSNDLMMYSIVEAESPETAAEIFKDHPHFGIPGATIDIMPIRPM